MKLEHKALIYLTGMTLFWGITFPLIKLALLYVGANTFVAIRFTVAAVFFLPIVWPKIRRINKTLMGYGAILGILNTGVYVFQTIGLQTTSSSNAAFIQALNVVMIPFFMPFFKLGRPNMVQIICSLIALYGIYVLTGANMHAISSGDIWVFASAIVTALFVCALQLIARYTNEISIMSFLQIVFLIPIPLVLSHPENYANILHPIAVVSILFCAIFATCVAYYWEFKWQPKTTAAKAALIYAMEPVFATIFAWLITKEAITQDTITGGLIILGALLISELSPKLLGSRT